MVITIDFVVCIKQVPRTGEVEVDPETGNLIRSGVASQTNPYDLHALEAALSLREKLGGTVTAVSMGPPQAEMALREALWMGVDEGILLSDAAFAGADTLATAYTLSRVLRRISFDLIFAGMQTTDGDTAQVGPGLAEFLDIPSASYVRQLSLPDHGRMRVVTDLAGDEAVLEIELPCLLTVTPDLNQPRLPSLGRRLDTADRKIPVWGRSELENAPEVDLFGLDGSPTRVKRVFPPQAEATRETWKGEGRELGQRLCARLWEMRFL
jgi:electron transfer flavoprotein beta subunit